MIKSVETNVSELSIEQLKKEVLTLRRENYAALMTVDKLLKDANQKNEQIKHLENLVSTTVPVIKKTNDKIAVVSSETEIAEIQLERLRQASQNRSLTLEEIRAYDLLVKNKRLVLDESTINLGKNQYRDVADADLLKLAASQAISNDNPDAE